MKVNRAGKGYDGSKRVALYYNGNVIPENFEVFSVCDVMGTSAVQRELKLRTGLNYDVIPVNFEGEFEISAEYQLTKVKRLFTEKFGCVVHT